MSHSYETMRMKVPVECHDGAMEATTCHLITGSALKRAIPLKVKHCIIQDYLISYKINKKSTNTCDFIPLNQ